VNLQNIVKMRLSTRLVALTLKIFLKRTAAFIAKSYGPLNFFLDLAGCALQENSWQDFWRSHAPQGASVIIR
jgi:hypothetical protein